MIHLLLMSFDDYTFMTICVFFLAGLKQRVYVLMLLVQGCSSAMLTLWGWGVGGLIITFVCGLLAAMLRFAPSTMMSRRLSLLLHCSQRGQKRSKPDHQELATLQRLKANYVERIDFQTAA